jgi:hypothetical protein
MEDSFPAARHSGNPHWATEHIYRASRSGRWKIIFSFVMPWGIFWKDPPLWIMWRRRHNPNVVPPIGQPFSHFAYILTGACRFGFEVNRTDQNTHNFLFNSASEEDLFDAIIRTIETRVQAVRQVSYCLLGTTEGCMPFVKFSRKS